jgi:hypothetical protein
VCAIICLKVHWHKNRSFNLFSPSTTHLKDKNGNPFACLWSLMMWGVGTNFDFHVLNKNFLRKNRHSSSMSHKL